MGFDGKRFRVGEVSRQLCLQMKQSSAMCEDHEKINGIAANKDSERKMGKYQDIFHSL
jgi:hypothetical protein